MRKSVSSCFSVSLLALCLSGQQVSAADYPDMVGVWEGRVRTVSSGNVTEGTVARGGMVINEIDLKVTIEHQDQESFMGKSRASTTPSDVPSARVWGTIRSNGEEAAFITSNGGRGTLWFESAQTFEYCITNLLENSFTAYCARLTKNGS